MDTNSVAIKDFGGEAGGTAWWTLGKDVRLSELAEAWARAGLPEDWLPELPSLEQRLGRAVRTVTALRKLARPIARKGHWALVSEVVTKDAEGNAAGVTHEQTATVQIRHGELHFEPYYAPQVDAISGAYHASYGVLDRDDVALWLVEVLEKVHGTPLRPRGGVYYVPSGELNRWRTIGKVLADAKAGDVYTLPTLAGDEAHRAVLDALTREVLEATAEVEAQALEGAVKGRGLRSRVRECEALTARIGAYESLLGAAVDKLRDSVARASDCALQAALQIELEAETAAQE